MEGRTCAVVLVGSSTAGRKWINFEIEEAWRRGMGLVGIHIHGLKDPLHWKTPPFYGVTTKGANPFTGYNVNGTALTEIVRCYDPTGADSKALYAWIEQYLEAAIDEAVATRKKY
jgi:hypothetical protein